MPFWQLYWSILICSYQEIPWPSSKNQPWKTFHVQKCEQMEITLKIKVFGKSISFCKYLRNECWDLHEMLYNDQLLSCEIMSQILWRIVKKYARTRLKCALARFYCECVRLRLACKHLGKDHHEIWNLGTQDNNFMMLPAFVVEIFGKKIGVSEYFNFQCIFHFLQFHTSNSFKLVNYWMGMEFLGNYKVIKKNARIFLTQQNGHNSVNF